MEFSKFWFYCGSQMFCNHKFFFFSKLIEYLLFIQKIWILFHSQASHPLKYSFKSALRPRHLFRMLFFFFKIFRYAKNKFDLRIGIIWLGTISLSSIIWHAVHRFYFFFSIFFCFIFCVLLKIESIKSNQQTI